MENFDAYLTGTELFGQTTSLETIIEILRSRVKPSAMLLILSQLGSSNQEDSETFKNDFLRYVDHLLNQAVAEQPTQREHLQLARQWLHHVIDKRPIYFPQGISMMWKYILAYSYPPTLPSRDDVRDQYIITFALCMRMGDIIAAQSQGPEIDLFQSFVFGERPNFAQSLVRTIVLYGNIAKDRGRYRDNDYFDFEPSFINKFGVSLRDYITALFGLYSMWKHKIDESSGNIREDWYQGISTAFANTTMSTVMEELIKSLCFTFDEGKAGCMGNVSNSWDFSFLHDHPFFLLERDYVIPVSLPVLEYALTEGLFWKIRHCFPNDDVSFQNFFGKPLEFYVFDLISGACEKGSSAYQVFGERKFGTKSQMYDSPDALIRVGNKVLAIEVKAKRLVYKKSVAQGESSSIESDRCAMTVKPMRQLYDAVTRIFSNECEDINLGGVTEVHLVTATLGEFPHLPFYEDKTQSDWSVFSGIDAKVYFHHMCIEDIEVLAGLLTRRSSAVFSLMRNASMTPYMSFRRFIVNQGIRVRSPGLFEEEFKNFISTAARNLFNV